MLKKKGRMSRRLKGSLSHSQFLELSQFSLRAYVSKGKVHLENGPSSVITPKVSDLNNLKHL